MLACTVQQSDAWTEYLQLHLSFALTNVHLCMQVLVMFSFEFQDYNVPFQPAVVDDAVPCEHTYIHMYVCMHILYVHRCHHLNSLTDCVYHLHVTMGEGMREASLFLHNLCTLVSTQKH